MELALFKNNSPNWWLFPNMFRIWSSWVSLHAEFEGDYLYDIYKFSFKFVVRSSTIYITKSADYFWKSPHIKYVTFAFWSAFNICIWPLSFITNGVDWYVRSKIYIPELCVIIFDLWEPLCTESWTKLC